MEDSSLKTPMFVRAVLLHLGSSARALIVAVLCEPVEFWEPTGRNRRKFLYMTRKILPGHIRSALLSFHERIRVGC
jgi:hypothetical protein